ncbi:MAG: CinA family protein [Candidatus Omnitrophica bacterium]|nr:CinA family protein [Candidatus Omnitrophota bacterium]
MIGLALVVNQLLLKQKKTLAVAESCTGGLLSNLLTNIPGSSQYFLLGLIAYSNKAKTSFLKVSPQIINKYGAVSKQTASLMARNIRRIAHADYGMGITGIAGPRGATKKKSILRRSLSRAESRDEVEPPIGTVYISIAGQKAGLTEGFCFSGPRLEVKRKAALKALSILKNLLLKKSVSKRVARQWAAQNSPQRITPSRGFPLSEDNFGLCRDRTRLLYYKSLT